MYNTKNPNNYFAPFKNALDNWMNENWNNNGFACCVGNDCYQSVPAVNIKETENDYKIEVAAPGLTKEDFKLDVEDNVLTVSTQKESKNEEKNENFTRKEFSFSSFERTFTLPKTIDAENISANYQDGVMVITLPKRKDAKSKTTKTIPVS